MWSKDWFAREKDQITPANHFFKDRHHDRFAQSQSFFKINGIDSITVDLFKRSTRAIFKDWKDRKIKDQKLKDGKIKFPTLPTGTMIRVGNLIIGFSIKSIVFCVKRLSGSICLWLIFFKDRGERFYYNSIFLIFLKHKKDWKIEDRKIERSNSQPWK